MMPREQCLRILARHIPEEIVVSVYTAAFDWIVIRPHALNYTSVGAMGLASSHALGLALGRPDRKVIVLDGDGSLLMNLGSLVTIGAVAPRNLIHFVCENGTYEANGGHPIPGRERLSFAGLAKSAGYAGAHEFSDLADFERRIAGVLQERGPVLVELKLIPGVPSTKLDYGLLYRASGRAEFKSALAQT
jgi:phosphonopyruvate decarboxylase